MVVRSHLDRGNPRGNLKDSMLIGILRKELGLLQASSSRKTCVILEVSHSVGESCNEWLKSRITILPHRRLVQWLVFDRYCPRMIHLSPLVLSY